MRVLSKMVRKKKVLTGTASSLLSCSNPQIRRLDLVIVEEF